MKKKRFFAAIAALLTVVIVLGATSFTQVEAKAKAKLPKNGQKFEYSKTFDELVPESDGSGYWIVQKKNGIKQYKPVVKVRRNKKDVIIHGSEMYVEIGKLTYYVDEDGYICFNTPDGYQVSKYGYVIFPGKWTPGSKPKGGETFYSKSFKELTGYGDGIWIVDKTGTKPVVVDESGVRIAAQYCYLDIDGYTFYTNKDGYIASSNPDGYSIHKNGYIIKSDSEPTKTTPEPTKTPTQDVKPDDSKYTIKKEGDKWICLDKSGNWVYGWVGDYYFTSWSGMALGLTYIDGEYYYFSQDLNSMGKVQKDTWVGSQYFGPDGKAFRSQKAVIGGKTYYFNDSGFIQTGWVNGEFYSSEPDRYGQLVPGVSK